MNQPNSPTKKGPNPEVANDNPKSNPNYNLVNKTDVDIPLSHNDITVTINHGDDERMGNGPGHELGEHKALIDSRPSDVKQAEAKGKMEDLTQSLKLIKRHKEQINTPKQFLKNVAFSIQLSDLMRVKTCCSYHELHQYAGVVIEVVHEELKSHYGGSFLMQVWTAEGQLYYSQALNFEPLSMNIFDGAFLYLKDPRDNNDRLTLTVVNLVVTGSEMDVFGLITDASFKHLGYANDHLFVASNHDFRSIKLENPLNDMEKQIKDELDVSETEVSSLTISKSLNIHGFFSNGFEEQASDSSKIMCFVELEDNQMSCQIIELKDSKYIFTPYREYFHKEKAKVDPIQDFKYIVNSVGVLYSIALRKSGVVDLYHNYAQVGESSNYLAFNPGRCPQIYTAAAKYKYSINGEDEINIPMQWRNNPEGQACRRPWIPNLFVRIRSADPQKGYSVQSSKLPRSSLLWNSNTLLLPSMPIQFGIETFKNIEITYGDVFARNTSQNAYKISIFNPKDRVTFEAAEDMEIVKDRQWEMIGVDKIKQHLKLFSSMLLGRRSFIVSHGKVVSIFDLILNEWAQHFTFNEDVHSILKDKEAYGEQTIFIVLQSGKIELAFQKFSSEDTSWQLVPEGQYLDGKILKVVSDFETLQHHFIMTSLNSQNEEEEPIKQIYYLHENKELHEGDEIVKFQREGTGESEVMLNFISKNYAYLWDMEPVEEPDSHLQCLSLI